MAVGEGHVRDVVFVRDPNRELGGHDVAGNPDVEGSGLDCGGGHAKQHQAFESF